MRPTPTDVRELDALVTTPDEAVIETVRGCDGDIAVLGAAGKMGFHFCVMLRRAIEALGSSSRVLAVSRFGSVRSAEEFEDAGCRVVRADLTVKEQLDAVPECEHLFFLAGIKFGTSQDPALLRRMNIEMPAQVAERFRNSRFVALSTGCVYSFTSPDTGGSTEEDPTAPPGQYAESCLGREKAFVDAAERFGTRSSLIRLNYSIDLRYGVLVDIASQVLAGRPVDLSTGHVNVIWQGDAVRHAIRSIEFAAAPPFVLNVTGPGVLSVREIAESFGSEFQKSVSFRGEQQPEVWLNNAARAHQLFGRPQVSVDQMIRWVAGWLKQGGPLLGKPTQFQVRDGKY